MAKRPPAYPDFILIGAPQSGAEMLKAALLTSEHVWFPPLDNILAFHPSFQLVRFLTLKKFIKKELPFHLKDIPWLLRFFLRPAPSLKWYGTLFHTKQEDALKGEFSDEYSTLPYDGVEKLHRIIPKAKIILMVRNPIDRAYAGLRERFKAHKKMPFSRMTKRQLVAAMNNDWAKTHSGYQSTLDNWGVFFKREQMFIGFYDELVADPHRFFKKLFDFLELPDGTPLPELPVTSSQPFPSELYKFLDPFYRKEIEGLAKRLGGSATTWILPPQQSSQPVNASPPQAAE